MTLTQLFTDIANAIRNKTGSSGKIKAIDFASQIDSIGGTSAYQIISYGYNTSTSKTFIAEYTGSIILVVHTTNSSYASLSINGTSVTASNIAKYAVVYVCSVNKGDTVTFAVNATYSYVVLNCTGAAYVAYNNCASRTYINNTMSNIAKGRGILTVATHQGRSDGTSPISGTSSLLTSTTGTSPSILTQGSSGVSYCTQVILYKTNELSSIKTYDTQSSWNSAFEYRYITQIWF